MPIVRYIHLFPTHPELENGLVPNVTQAIYMHQAGFTYIHMYPHYFKDSQTGRPISLVRTAPDGEASLNVDYNIDRRYHEEIEETEEICANDSFNDSREISFHWEDVIEEVELRSPLEQSCNSNVNCLQDGEIVDISDIRDEKATQTISSTAAPLHIPETNRNSNPCNIPINQTHKEQVKTNNAGRASPIKQPLRPPPGYNPVPPNCNNHVPPNSYNHVPPNGYNHVPPNGYNHVRPNGYNPQVQPSNYIHAQTYIGLPYLYQTQPYLAFSQYSNQYYHNTIQHLMQLGARLTLEQQNYLRSLGAQSSCNTPWGCSNQSTAPPFGGGYSSFGYNQTHGQDFQHGGWGSQGTKNTTGSPQPETDNFVNVNVPTAKNAPYTKRPVNPIKIEAPIDVAPLKETSDTTKNDTILPKTVPEDLTVSTSEFPRSKNGKAVLNKPAEENGSRKGDQHGILPEIPKSRIEEASGVDHTGRASRNDGEAACGK